MRERKLVGLELGRRDVHNKRKLVYELVFPSKSILRGLRGKTAQQVDHAGSDAWPDPHVAVDDP